ncbi:Tobamovirus multiplication protein 2A [Rhynchospora pubera]|uniref:Tobamovirus multiplication protein 2A n=1 Tax=Rhynchospora pubera TaxID=906938 RepID=A0AAV8G327_9POAL|nr:Tobamovirus multiplication protein 2A [Rhynchospora pubera]
MATCSEFLEGLLKMLNFALGTLGLIMLGYGVYLFVESNQISGDEDIPQLFQLSRVVLVDFGLPNSFVNKLPKTWFIYVLTGIGGSLFITSLFGYIGAITKSRLCLSLYIFLVLLLVVFQLIGTAFILLDRHLTDVIRADKTGYLHEMYEFLKHNWKAMKWVALGVVILEALAFLVAFVVRALNAPPDESDSDMEFESPAGSNRQLLVHSQGGESYTDQENNSGQEPIRTDTWSQRMREKYGLNTSDFTYNPAAPTPTDEEERRRCNIV